MANRKKPARIEPSFDAFGADEPKSGFFVSEEDRVVPTQPRSKSGSSKASSRREPAGTARKGGRGRKKRRGFFGFLKTAAYWSMVLCLWAGIAGVGLVAYIGAKMPAATTWSIPDRPPNVRIIDMNGQLVANRGMTGGEEIGLHEMSPFIPQAVIAIEDRRFYSHFGVDPIGLARAFVSNIVDRRLGQGGSTLTQQLAKNLFLKPERTIERKVQEVLMAFWLERTYTKDQILEMYLNRVYFGSGSYGVEAASRRYFSKSARDVSLSEAALLAGLLKAPSRLSPARDPQAAEKRAKLVLAAMREENMIGDAELQLAMNAPAVRAPAFWTGSENYVADRIMEELPELIGEVRTDIVVETTVDLVLQTFAEGAIRNVIDAEGKKHNVSQGALVSIDASGAVRAMVGGYDYATSQFDRASEAKRQPGSAFKPFVYMAALENGYFPDTIVNDAPIKIGKWAPKNFNDKYYGQIPLSTALARSVNSVAAQLAQQVGPAAIVETAWRMGIQSNLEPNLSIALGTSEVTPLELTSAYVPFSNGGFRPEIHFVRRIKTAKGEVLYEHKASMGPRVARAEIIGMMNSMMAGAVKEGTAKRAAFGWPAAGKTGTSQNSRDAWFVGFTANLTTGVWLGNDDGSPTKGLTGGQLPAQAWHDFMTAAHEGVPVAQLPGGWNGRVLSDIESVLSQSSDGGNVATAPTGSVQPAAQGGGRIGSIMDIILGN
ncbi:MULTISPECIES: transglycosylase domain-containing protein [unclassified Aminobacter]|uniref:transglycosylase domain-containing protein n=1 Tax=unclassified Aminobacter TaxID=2644704 RepID=UPI000466EA88|nr:MULTISPECIES: transglycosylase domain-containing protein [unclassified Aminobacter]TWG49165.1 penicillin-binding protein 1A [Aminobacter sp. J44]TWH30837.1 penicillin-binding protein 1A [Aminobacter sp. J15]